MLKTHPDLDNGFPQIANNTAERAMKPISIGRKNWRFAWSERGGNPITIAFTRIGTAKLNKVDAQVLLTSVPDSINDYKITKLNELMP